MKKILMLAFMGMTTMSFSRGLDFKIGFDSFRTLTSKEMKGASQGSGFILGLDGIVFDSRYVDLGLGLEYNGGLYLNKYETSYNTNITTKGYTVPIYGLIHFNIYKNKYASIYPILRLGYAISKLDNGTDLSGVYYAAGLGTNVKNFIFEGFYDGIYGNKAKAFTHKIGIRIGYSLDFDKLKTDAQKTVLVYPKKLKVMNLSNLTEEEKLSIINSIKNANKNAPIKEIKVDDEGNVLVIYNDNSTYKIDKSKIVRRKTDAERTVLLEPERVQVYNLSNLTQKEKYMVGNAIIAPNKNAPIKEIVIDNEGNALVIFNDGTRVKMDKSKTVREKEIEVVKGVLPTNCTIDAKKCIIRGFEIDGKEPSLEEQKSLKEIAKIMNEYSNEYAKDVINIVGHTDSTGTEEYNQKLSIERAEKVAELLRKYGLKSNIKFGIIKGEGELNPIDTNRTKKGRYNNRRVVIIFDDLKINN